MRTRLENGLSGFILTRNLSDKKVDSPEERVHVSVRDGGREGEDKVFLVGGDDYICQIEECEHEQVLCGHDLQVIRSG